MKATLFRKPEVQFLDARKVVITTTLTNTVTGKTVGITTRLHLWNRRTLKVGYVHACFQKLIQVAQRRRVLNARQGIKLSYVRALLKDMPQ
jgi:hypothetical protein